MPDLHILADATNLADAARSSAHPPPDVLISAASLDGASILPLLLELRARWQGTRIVLIVDTSPCDEFDAYACRLSASCLRWSDLTPQTLQYCLLAVLEAPLRIFSASLSESLRAPSTGSGPGNGDEVQLSPRALAVLEGLATGQTQQQVAAAQGVSLRTVKRIVAELETQLGAPSLFMLALAAERLGLLRQPSAETSRAVDGLKGPAG